MKKQTRFDPVKHRIFEGLFGSRLYGTDTPESDMDTRGVCLPPMGVLLDPFHNFDVQDSGFEEEDRAIYALGKFFKLCADANPNIVELLFVPQSKTIFSTPQWEHILANRELFLSTKAKYTFTGYAFSQLNRVKSHREWFIDPPKREPKRKDFGLKDVPLVSEIHINSLFALPQEVLTSDVREELQRERGYREVQKKWRNYQAWLKNRNPKRRELEDKFGYDTKYVSHIFRLMSEGKELLLTGNITLPLPNAEEIRAIKNGLYDYETMMELATSMESDFETWYKFSVLPHSPNIKKISELYFSILDEMKS